VLSEHRFTLVRHLDTPDKGVGCGTLLWIMLNPSTADKTTDDPTIRRVKAFTAREGFRRLIVVNLFSQRATKPTDLRSPSQAEHRLNMLTVHNAMSKADRVVVAWGSTVPRQVRFATFAAKVAVIGFAHENGIPLYCLGRTNTGEPRHPLYVKGARPLEEYRCPG
jgi:hypothetical protein